MRRSTRDGTVDGMGTRETVAATRDPFALQPLAAEVNAALLTAQSCL